MTNDALIHWLLDGDVSIQYQVHRDLLDQVRPELQQRIKSEGWGQRFLAKRLENRHWGNKFYHPKWTSSHYTLLDLKNLAIQPDVPEILETVNLILKEEKDADGGINPHTGGTIKSDVCVNGMFLNYACYFRVEESGLRSIVDFLLAQHMHDGGFNCQSNRGKGCTHSSLHSTLSVAEGILEYKNNGYAYRLGELLDAAATSREFMLVHRLFKSHRTGAVIDPKMTMLSWPSRWRFDMLRALDYFQNAGCDYDERMADAIEILLKKRAKTGEWPLQARHPGATHFEMETVGKKSRWNTLRALRVLKKFETILL